MAGADITVVLGFDFGLSRIGMAVGQTVTQTASPAGILAAKGGEPNWDEIAKAIRRWKPQLLLVGLPLNADASNSEIGQQAKTFANALEQFNLPIQLVDERYSTREARWKLEELHGNRQGFRKVDDIAACLIVETWLKHLG